MATSNFSYENRCIVVENEDFEFGNVPEHNEYDKNSSRCYPSSILDESDFDFWNVVLTSGYYSDACIDYKQRLDEYGQDMVTSRMRYCWSYDSVKQLINDFVDEFKLSVYRVRKLIGKLSECVDLEHFCERAFCRVHEYLSKIEEIKVNEFLDELKQRFDYAEYEVYAQFSNGETLYQRIG